MTGVPNAHRSSRDAFGMVPPTAVVAAATLHMPVIPHVPSPHPPPHTRTHGRILVSVFAPMPETSSSWSTLVNLPMLRR